MSKLHGLKRLPYNYLGLMIPAEKVEQAVRKQATRGESAKETALLPLALAALGATEVSATHGRVTIVLPTYNRHELLARAIESAIGQSVTDWHCLVINDGGEIPTLPRDERFTLLNLPGNVGNPAVVRNLAIAAARTPFIAFLDDDNEWMPDHLATLLSHLEKCDCRLVYSYCTKVDENGRKLGVIGKPFSVWQLSRYNFVDNNAIMFRNLAGMSVPVMPRRRSSWRKEDWAFVVENAKRGTVHGVPVETVRYLVNSRSYRSNV